MTNPFFTAAAVPAASTSGRSVIVRNEYFSVQTGFDLVNVRFTALDATVAAKDTAIAQKGAIAGQTWTGTHDFTGGLLRAPSPVGASDAATKGYADSLAYSATLANQLIRSARTANTILAGADKSILVDITSGTFTQTFTAAASLGSGWYCYIRNSGTGDITLDPNGAELIDGLSSFIMYPGEARLVQCDGSAFTSVVLTPFLKKFTASGTFTKPPGYAYFSGNVWSAGGSGAYATSGSGAGGGGGGACFNFNLQSSSVGTTEAVTIGAGGVAQTVANTAGTAGGNSSFGTLVVAVGGGAGTTSGGGAGGSFAASLSGYSSMAAVPAGSGNHPGGSCVAGGGGGGAWDTGTGAADIGGSSTYAGGAGGAAGSATAAAGGSSVFAGAGSAGVRAGVAVAGTVPSGGGGAAYTPATASGAGARGECHIWGIS